MRACVACCRSMNGSGRRRQVAQILYTARDPFSRRVIIDKGQQDKIAAGLPVVDDAGIVGQVTGFPFLSEVTLITDKGAGGAGADRAQRSALGVFGPAMASSNCVSCRSMPTFRKAICSSPPASTGSSNWVSRSPRVMASTATSSYSFARILCRFGRRREFRRGMVLAARTPPAPAGAGPRPSKALRDKANGGRREKRAGGETGIRPCKQPSPLPASCCRSARGSSLSPDRRAAEHAADGLVAGVP